MSKTQRCKAFTLIELLIVIAIISILAAILFPVFARAREQARKAACMSNLKQIGLGLMMYVQDYDESYPGTYMYRNEEGNQFWYEILQPYIKNGQVFVCPTAGEIVDEDGNKHHSGGYTYNTYGGQKVNGNDDTRNGFGYRPGSWRTYNGSGPIKMSEVDEPAQTIIIHDPDSSGDKTTGYTSLGYSGSSLFTPVLHGGQIPPNPNTGTRVTSINPTGGGNYVFADGHVKYITYSESRRRKNGKDDIWNVKKGM